MTKGGLGSRFFGLTFVGYVAALVTVAVAVWFASAPALEKMQVQALESHVQTKANVVGDVIDALLDDGRLIAADPRVQAFLVGETGRAAEVSDLLGGFSDFQQIRLFDYRGREALRVGERPPGTRFFQADVVGIFDQVASATTPQVLYRPGAGPQEAQFIVAIAVKSRGFVEGILVLERHLDLTHVLKPRTDAPATELATEFQIQMSEAWDDTGVSVIATQVPGTGVFLRLVRDDQIVETLGREMVWRVLAVVCIALLAPFTMMALAGIRSIIAPHRALEISRAELAIKQREFSELAQIAEMAHEAIIVTGTDLKIVWTNPGFSRLTGYAESEVIGRSPGALLQGHDTNPETRVAIREAVAREEPIRTEIVNYRKDGTPYWIYLSISPIRDRDGQVARFAAISTDITATKLAQARLEQARKETEHQALHDTLTGMANRRFLERVLDREVTSGSPDRTIVRIDLDHFKHVNDTLGHAAGDHVLRVVAEILKNNVHSSDLAARVGGDEFVILLGAGRTGDDGEALATVLMAEIRKDMSYEGRLVRIGASFGICAASDGLVDNESLLLSADAALYVAKIAGRNTITRYTPEIHHDVLDKRKVSVEIEAAIRNGEFEAYFQPQFDAVTHELSGVEALARWNHPSLGILLPGSFLPIAEQLRLVPEIDRLIHDSALSTVAALNQEGLFVPKISFNVGIALLQDPKLAELRDMRDIGETVISFELLESVLVEEQGDEFDFNVDRLRDRGYRIEVDDFGSGHASVIGLKKLRPDVVKLDQLLIRPLTQSDASRALVQSMIDIGRVLNVSVTAEGVETAEHAEILKELGCDTLQGYHFAKPLSAEGLRALLRQKAAERPGDVVSLKRNLGRMA